MVKATQKYLNIHLDQKKPTKRLAAGGEISAI
jgi:hypothetical protein